MNIGVTQIRGVPFFSFFGKKYPFIYLLDTAFILKITPGFQIL